MKTAGNQKVTHSALYYEEEGAGLPAPNLDLEGKGMCRGERGESLLCNETRGCQQLVPRAWKQDSLWSFLSFQPEYRTLHLLLNMTCLLRMEAEGQSRTKLATVASGFKSQPLPSSAGVRPCTPLLKVDTPFSLQNQYFNNEPIHLGCSFLMFRTSST